MPIAEVGTQIEAHTGTKSVQKGSDHLETHFKRFKVSLP